MSAQEAVFSIIHSIPAGSVATYGQVARLAGLPNGARAVGQVLKNLPAETSLPWHRVINAKGEISLPAGSAGYSLQLQRLSDEGVTNRNGKIFLKHYQWEP